jgi:hypothetical protein
VAVDYQTSFPRRELDASKLGKTSPVLRVKAGDEFKEKEALS